MALSKRLAMYADVHTVLETALLHNGGRIKLPTEGKARHWCQRANYYRKLLHAAQVRQSALTEPITSTPYDGFTFRRAEEDKSIVVIEYIPLPESFIAPDGTVVDLKEETALLVETLVQEDEDELLTSALDFAATLTGGGNDE